MKVNKEVAAFLEQQERVTLGFSTGKDSLACALLLRELHVEFIPFFFYHVPDLEFVERNLKMYEDYFQVHIVRLPHPMLYDYLRHQDFQPPDMLQYLHDTHLPHLTFSDLIGCYLDSQGIDDNLWDVVGQRASESFNSRKLFETQGFFNRAKRKIFPICDWHKADVLGYIKQKGCRITDDYRIFRRSFDGLKYQFLFGVRENYPADYERIKEYFPLIDLELFRYENNNKYYQQA
jgi:3'-phosphoadenosine 5'-phosphosulfate sulfotransferase (PAPS reductase)/FAD synthetase